MGFLNRIKKRVNEPPEQSDSREIRDWSSCVEGATPIRDLKTRTTVRTCGVVQSIVLRPGPEGTSLEVSLFDGTGVMSSVWLGRHRIPGIDLGTRMIVEGTTGACRQIADGSHLQILNPAYELLPAAH